MANKEIELDLNNKGKLFRVVGFVSNVELPEKPLEQLSRFFETEEEPSMRDLIKLIQAFGSVIAEHEDELDELLADLADVDVSDIKNLGSKEYIELVASFFEVDFIRQVRQLYREFQA